MCCVRWPASWGCLCCVAPYLFNISGQTMFLSSVGQLLIITEARKSGFKCTVAKRKTATHGEDSKEADGAGRGVPDQY